MTYSTFVLERLSLLLFSIKKNIVQHIEYCFRLTSSSRNLTFDSLASYFLWAKNKKININKKKTLLCTYVNKTHP